MKQIEAKYNSHMLGEKLVDMKLELHPIQKTFLFIQNY